jgi:metalloendopeptidase OMA1, mitochondrial
MRGDPFGSQNDGRRRGLGGGIRWWVLLAFAGYAAWYWFANAARTRTPARRC